MTDFPTLFLLLLVPVTLLLLLTRNLARRIRYPHDLLAAEGRRDLASLLPRSFRTHYDLIFDLTLAALVALALAQALSSSSGLGGGGRAVVIDCSRSMFGGIPGSRPIDAALKALETRPEFAGVRRWGLLFEAGSASTRLLPWEGLAGGMTGEALVTRLEGELTLLDPDYAALGELKKRGYGEITLLTDSLRFEPRGFSALEFGFAGPREGQGLSPAKTSDKLGRGGPAEQADSGAATAAWPSSSGYDRIRKLHYAAFVEGGRHGALSVRVLDEGGGAWAPLSGKSYAIEEGQGGRRVILTGPGTYLFEFSDPLGGLGAVFALRIPPALRAAEAEGEFSKLMLSIFPLLETAPRPSLFLGDLGASPPGPEARRAATIITTRVEEEGFVLDPGQSGGRPLAAGLASGADFAWGQAGLANADLPLVYDRAIALSNPMAFATLPPPGSRLKKPAGAAVWLALEPGGSGSGLPLNPTVGEFWEPVERGSLELEGPRVSLLLALLCVLVLAAKYLTWRALSGRRLFSRSAFEP